MNEDEECIICLELLSNNRLRGGLITFYSCNHVFHASCVLEWLTKSGGKRCPACWEPLIVCDCCGRYSVVMTLRRREQERSLIDKLKRAMPFFMIFVFCVYIFLSRLKSSWTP